MSRAAIFDLRPAIAVWKSRPLIMDRDEATHVASSPPSHEAQDPRLPVLVTPQGRPHHHLEDPDLFNRG